MRDGPIRAQIEKRTKDAFGRHVWPHVARSIAATSFVDHDPDMITLVPDLLGHADHNTAQKYYVFSSDGRTHVSGYSKGKAALGQFLAAKGEPLAAWKLHDLRRSAATHMVRLGISETIVGRVLNHARQGVTAKTYALHSYAPEKRHALDAWAAEIDRAVNRAEGDNVVALHG